MSPTVPRVARGGCRARTASSVLATMLLTACSSVSFFVANAPTYGGSYQRRVNQTYGTLPRQQLDVYFPEGNPAHRPVVVFFYGGSWTAGSKSNYRFVGAALAARGYVTVIPDYRLYPSVTFPSFVEDGAAAVAWVHNHAGEFGGDPDRIVLMGHSAGGHMAAILALDGRYVQAAGVDPRFIAGLIGLSGPYALNPNSDTLRATFPPPSTPADWQPYRFVSDQSPPTLLLPGPADKVVSLSHAEKLRDALREHHVRVVTDFYPNRGHTDTVGSFALIDRKRTPALQETIDFLGSLTQRNDQ